MPRDGLNPVSYTHLDVYKRQDNELDEAYRWYDKLEEFPTNRVNREAVQRAVLENDTSSPFLDSSPCSPFPEEPGAEDPNSDLQGDMHLYLTPVSYTHL